MCVMRARLDTDNFLAASFDLVGLFQLAIDFDLVYPGFDIFAVNLNYLLEEVPRVSNVVVLQQCGACLFCSGPRCRF